MWVWITIGIGVWFAVSILLALAAGRFFGNLRERVAWQRRELLERQRWANRPPTRATERGQQQSADTDSERKGRRRRAAR